MLTRLIARADVLVENFRPGVLARIGFDAARLKALRPSLVVCSINGFGSDGPVSRSPGVRLHRPGDERVHERERQCRTIRRCARALPISDLVAGLYAALAITAALRRAQTTGEGQAVEVSLTNGLISLLAYIATNYFATGVVPPRAGNDHPIAAPYGLFATRDGHVALAPPDNIFFGRLMDALGVPELKDDPLFRTQSARVANRTRINAIVGGKLALRTTEHWVTALNAAGVPCGPVHGVDDVFQDPQVVAQQMVLEVEHPGHGLVRMLGFPMKFAETPCRVRRPAPGLGRAYRRTCWRSWVTRCRSGPPSPRVASVGGGARLSV